MIDDLKLKARSLGLWNLFLPKNHFKQGAGFSNLEYGLMAEYTGKCRVAAEVRNLLAECQNLAEVSVVGYELCCAGYWEHGSPGKIRG